MKKTLLLLYFLASFLLALNACKKEEIKRDSGDFLTCKIDGEPFGKENLTAVPFAEYDATASPGYLKITSSTSTMILSMYIYDQTDYTGTFRFGDEVPGFHYHFAVITSVPGEYITDSWFATGDAVNAGLSGGSVTISRYDTVNHRIKGSFEATLYNSNKETTKVITEGEFSLSLITFESSKVTEEDPKDPVPRQEMAMILLKAIEGNGYLPPEAIGLFTDVPPEHSDATWIEEFANRLGIPEAACGTDPPAFCPGDVGQELLASKFNVLNSLNFWVRQKADASAEVNFVIQHDGKIVPIEVKSGSTGSLRSLHAFMDAAPHNLAVRLYSGRLKTDHITTLNGKDYRLLNPPYYLGGQIEKYLDWIK